MKDTLKSYIAIDLKSFYASVECMDRELNPLNTNLVVADRSRTEKTICLAVSPSLKAYGIPGRARLFEVISEVKRINNERRSRIGGKDFTGRSCMASELAADPFLELDFIAATPKMSRYMEVSSQIFGIYLKYIADEDIHVYSVDEVFMDVTAYLKTYNTSPKELASRMIKDVEKKTGITATAGIGTNLYLAKIALDIVAKHVEANEHGVRIAELDEMSYRRLLWDHRPLTDFWRIGKGISKKLEKNGMYTMGDIARCSLGRPDEFHNEDFLFKLFGVNAELLIDHAWGYEPCEMSKIKSYKPESSSLGHGQVLTEPYSNEKARLVIWEMADQLVLELVKKGLVTDQMVLHVGYDVVNLSDKRIADTYNGETKEDYYGRRVPKSAHGSVNLNEYTSSGHLITEAVVGLFDEITDKSLFIRRMSVTANNVIGEAEAAKENEYVQMSIFDLITEEDDSNTEQLEKEKNIQKAVLEIKDKYGNNAILKGANFIEGATARERNRQIGGHRA